MKKRHYNIVVSCSDEYFYPLKTMLYSLFINNDSTFHVFFLGPLSAIYKNKLCKMVAKYNGVIHYLDVDDHFFAEAPNADIWPRCYYKIAIPWILPTSIDNCLWLDSDVIIDGDISALFDSFDYNKPIGGCCHNPNLNVGEKFGITIDGKKYDSRLAINAGVVLFNNSFIRDNYSKNEYFSFFKKYMNYIKYVDQDFFNAYFNGNMYIFNGNRFNCLIDSSTFSVSRTFKYAVIIHYYYFKKPWHKGYLPCLPFFKYWRYGFFQFKIYQSIAVVLLYIFITPFKLCCLFMKKLFQ